MITSKISETNGPLVAVILSNFTPGTAISLRGRRDVAEHSDGDTVELFLVGQVTIEGRECRDEVVATIESKLSLDEIQNLMANVAKRTIGQSGEPDGMIASVSVSVDQEVAVGESIAAEVSDGSDSPVNQDADETNLATGLPAELIDAGLSERIVKALVENAKAKDEPRLLSLDGIRSWVGEGNQLDGDLESIGPKSVEQIELLVFPKT